MLERRRLGVTVEAGLSLVQAELSTQAHSLSLSSGFVP